MTTHIVTGVLVGALTSACATTAYEHTARPAELLRTTADSGLIDVGGYRLFAKWAGEGPITVVLDSHSPGDSQIWNELFPQIGRMTRTFAYDRAGLGRSELGTVPRSAEQATADLATLLERSGQRPPYLLVGFSLGGILVRHFAHRHPELVGGLLLVDPPAENTYDWALANRTEEQFRVVEEWIREIGPGAWEEWAAIPQILEATRAAWPLREVPVVVITATEIPPQPDWWDQPYRDHFTSEQQALVARLPSARLVVAGGSTHAVPLERPDVILEEVRKLLAEIRDREGI
jgi:pimeloyl-ACP methyl ester carboxylesterase